MGILVFLFLQSCVSADSPGATWDEIAAFSSRADALEYQEQNIKPGCYSTVQEVTVDARKHIDPDQEVQPK